jgi:uncharacterized protein YcgI (DUF1989 family)
MTKKDLKKSRKTVEEFVIPKCSAKAFIVKKGQVLRVIAHEGKQVADIRFLNAYDYREEACPMLSCDFNSRKGIGGSRKLKEIYSKPPWERLMVTIIDDKVGHHFLIGCCTPKMRELEGKKHTLSCARLFDECLKPYNISMQDLDWAGVFNLWMVVRFLDDENGTMVFDRPSCETGDYIEFLAEIDLLVASTSCPDRSIINDFEPKALKYQILE